MKRRFALLLSSLPSIGFGMGYQFHPFPSDRLIHSDSGRLRYFFELPPSVDILADGSFTMNFDTSSNLAKQQASVSILLNGQPCGSLDLTNAASKDEHWQLTLPRKFFKSGQAGNP